MPFDTVEVHNAWTIYGLNSDGTLAEKPIAQLSRPQDWGDSRWHYERFRFDWITESAHYIHHVHCWTDLQLAERGEYPMLFAQLIVQIAMPGTNPKLCGREYLGEDDFWNDDWGELPPYFDPYDDEEDEEE